MINERVILKVCGLNINFVRERTGGLFFESVGISEGVQSVFGRGTAGTHAGDHDCLVLFADEWVSQNEGQLAPSEGDVLCVLIYGSNAFLESQQGLVDFGPFDSPFLVVRLAVLRPFRPREVYHQDLTQNLVFWVSQWNLVDGVWPGGSVVRTSRLMK